MRRPLNIRVFVPCYPQTRDRLGHRVLYKSSVNALQARARVVLPASAALARSSKENEENARASSVLLANSRTPLSGLVWPERSALGENGIDIVRDILTLFRAVHDHTFQDIDHLR